MPELRELLREAAPTPRQPLDTDALLARARRRRPRWWRIARWTLAVVGLGVAGISVGGVLQPASDGDDPRVRTVRPVGTFAVEPLAQIPVEATWVSGLTVWGEYVAYVPDGESVVLVDVRTGDTRTVARPRLRNGEFYAVAGDGDWIVFAEMSGSTDERFDPGDGGREWRVAAVDLRTGDEREVAHREGERVPDPLVPFPSVDGRWAVWVQEAAPRSDPASLKVVVHDLDSWTTRVVDEPDTLGVEVDGDTLFLLRKTPGTEGLDLFARPVEAEDGGRRLTSSGEVTEVYAGDGLLVWYVQPRRDPAVASSGAWTMWARPVEPLGEPVRLGEGFGARPGAGFVLLKTEAHDLLLRGVGSGEPVVTVATGPAGSSSWDAAGDRIAWVSRPDAGPFVVHVARVVHRDG